MPATPLLTFWQYLRPLLAPFMLCFLVVLLLREPVSWWLHGEEKFDQEVIKEWIREAGNFKPLPELVRIYLEQVRRLRNLPADGGAASAAALQQAALEREKIQVHLKSLGKLLTQISDQLPLFPKVYQVTVAFDERLTLAPIVWDSELPRHQSQYRVLAEEPIDDQGTAVTVLYQLHAYTQRQAKERAEVTRRLWVSGLGVFFAVLALVWVYITQRRERERQRQRILGEQQVASAERKRLEEELRRQDAERRQQEAERQALELKSQLFANIGIMAGSYAHNIKNLLVRPNDLLRRCIEEQPLAENQGQMLREVRQTLSTVTERLQQILQTVRRDPSKSERVRIDLNALVRDMHRTWAELAREKWKLTIELDLQPDESHDGAPLWIEGDLSHLQQALENLVFNARDATFEMRNHLRDQARRTGAGENARVWESDSASTLSRSQTSGAVALDRERRQALIAAAAWKGSIHLRTRREGERAMLEVADNGIGMTEEVRRRCTETHFSTKRNNALFAGLSAGMGLGLSFVTVILEHHGARLEIESQPLRGATFRVSFPVAITTVRSADPA
jgi:signal transduction histidine kinase